MRCAASNASNSFCFSFEVRGIRPAKWYATESAELKSTWMGRSLILGCFIS